MARRRAGARRPARTPRARPRPYVGSARRRTRTTARGAARWNVRRAFAVRHSKAAAERQNARPRHCHAPRSIRYPGALPVIVANGAAMTDDLARRDFSHQRDSGVAAPTPVRRVTGHRRAALPTLTQASCGCCIRASFRDDPTRTFRAARSTSRGWGSGWNLRRASSCAATCGTWTRVSAARVLREIERLLAEQDAPPALCSCALRLGVLPAVEAETRRAGGALCAEAGGQLAACAGSRCSAR